MARGSLRNRFVRQLPALRMLGRNFRTLYTLQGFARSVKLDRPVDARDQPLPWYTYPAIEFLSQFDLSRSRIFEFGGGNSTRYLGARAAQVVTVEHDPLWHAEIVSTLPDNCRLLLRETPEAYANAVTEDANGFDIVVIDGLPEWRYACLKAMARASWKPAMVILDNAEWFPKSAAKLREMGYFQVDFSGFGPINGSAWTTSFFLGENARDLQRGFANPAPIGGDPFSYPEPDDDAESSRAPGLAAGRT